jgi:hypothetical protein
MIGTKSKKSPPVFGLLGMGWQIGDRINRNVCHDLPKDY